MPTRKSIVLLLLVMFVASGSVVAQGFSDQKLGGISNFLSFEGLRPSNLDDIFNTQFFKDSTYFFSSSYPEGNFNLDKKIEFIRNSQGNAIVELEFKRKQGLWVQDKRHEHSLNSTGLTEFKRSQIWSPQDESFLNHQRYFYSYNGLNLVQSETIEIFIEEEWLSLERIIYTYNDQGSVTEELNAYWNTETMAWIPNQRVQYAYNENDILLSETVQFWLDESQAWENFSFKGFVYNDDNQLISLIESRWDNSFERWEESSFQALSYTALGQLMNASTYASREFQDEAQNSLEASYDDHGNLNEVIFKVWDSDSQEWTSAEKQMHFWSEHVIGNLGSSSREITCFYNNPHIVGLPWLCQGLMKGETYQVSIFTHTGELHHIQQFIGGHTFRIAKSLPNGLYLVVIDGGLTRHTEKVLIRN